MALELLGRRRRVAPELEDRDALERRRRRVGRPRRRVARGRGRRSPVPAEDRLRVHPRRQGRALDASDGDAGHDAHVPRPGVPRLTGNPWGTVRQRDHHVILDGEHRVGFARPERLADETPRRAAGKVEAPDLHRDGAAVADREAIGRRAQRDDAPRLDVHCCGERGRERGRHARAGGHGRERQHHVGVADGALVGLREARVREVRSDVVVDY
mmetsp:Transcript_17741/g.54573  ORF Transcript_17741/g.54573 Transcript_17741/m.54573 type:complete len:213 (+) Transcript_17741:356-994(+)